MYRGTGVSRGVQRTSWERSLKIGGSKSLCFEEFLGGENVLGLAPASLPHTLGQAPPLPLPKNSGGMNFWFIYFRFKSIAERPKLVRN